MNEDHIYRRPESPAPEPQRDRNGYLESLKRRALHQQGLLAQDQRHLITIDPGALRHTEPEDPRDTPLGDAVMLLAHALHGRPIEDRKEPIQRLKEWVEAQPSMEWWDETMNMRGGILIHPIPKPRVFARLDDPLKDFGDY